MKVNEIHPNYQDTFGTWSVTTEGDAEGRTVRQLGVFNGHIDEIALHLADQCFYSLTFKYVTNTVEYTPKSDKVSIKFHADSKTWSADNLVDLMRAVFVRRNVQINKSNYYGSFEIKTNDIEAVEREERRKLYEELKKEFG